MTWLVFSILSAFFQSLIAVFGKKGTQKIEPMLVAWSQQFFALFILVPLNFWAHTFQPVNQVFLVALFISASLYTCTSILFFKAMKESPISLTLPILSFVPIFSLITSPLILGEFPSMVGLIGIIITVIGSYILNLGKRVDGLLEPLLSLVKEKGSRSMLIIAFIWSIASNLDRMAILTANPFIYSLCLSIMGTVLLTGILLYKKISFITAFKNVPLLAPVGVVTGLSHICYTIAFSMTIVPNVTAVKRTSGLFGIVLGKLLFKEDNIRDRFFGAAIMVVGVLIIILG